MAVMWSVFFVLCLVVLTVSARPCTKNDYVQFSLPCDEITRTRSIVHYLNATCTNGTTPPVPISGIPCDCPPGQELSRDLQSSKKCEPCREGEYGAGGEIINNWREWTNNGTLPPAGSDIITYCEKSRDYVKFCEAWKASDNFTIESGDNTLSRCMSSVLLITKKFVSSDSKVTFDYYVDSRECRSRYLGCDGLAFFIDSRQVLDYAGNQFQWKTMTYNLKPGIHTLKWMFRKACYSYGISFVDKAFIRSITLVGIAEPDLQCRKCPPGYYGTTKGASDCSACSYFQYQSEEGQTNCSACPSNTYSMLGASKCLPLPNCTIDDVIKPPGNVSTCSCVQSSTNCTTTVQPSYIKVKGFEAPRVLCNPVESSQPLRPETIQCRCQPGFQIIPDVDNPRCQPCEEGKYSTYGVKCGDCLAGQVALKGKHFYVWRNNTLPEGFTAQCSGDCSVKNGWISAGGDIRTERVVGDVHAVLQSPEVEVVSVLGRIVFNCSITCNMTGVSPKPNRGEHLAKIQDCNMVFQVWSNGTLRDQVNCTYPKGRYQYQHERKRDGETMAHIVALKKGKYVFRWVFHQEDDTRTLSTAFQAKVSNISILGTKEGQARNCTPCPAGYHSLSSNTDCIICPNGTSSPVGSEKCNPCPGESFAGKEGSATCLPCGNNTRAFPRKDGCDTGNCRFSPAEGVDYDLIKLSRVGGPMIEVLTYQTGPRPKRRTIIWPYKPAVYVNLCTVEHDNTSCTYRDPTTREKLPLPVMACRSSWYNDVNIGSVIGYKAKSDVRSGLVVELLHGDKCYAGGKNGRYKTTLDLMCDVKAGVGNPGPQTNYSNILRKCEYYLVWKSLYACPKCRKGDVTTIRGECINGTRNITYLPSIPCWGTGDGSHAEFKQESCEVPTVTTPVNGTVVDYRIQKSNKVNKILIGVGVLVILVLLGVAVFFVYKHRVMKYRYYTLMARNKPMSRLAQEDDEDNLIHEDELAEPASDMQGPIKI